MDDREARLLAALAERCGIFGGYHDLWGTYHHTSAETRRTLLALMRVRTGSLEDLEAELRAREEAARLCPAVAVVAEGPGQAFRLAAAVGDSGTLQLEGRADPVSFQVVADHGGGALARLERELPRGIHRGELRLGAGGETRSCRTRVAVAPARGYEPPVLERGGRIWGVNLPLYSLRSARDWGIGDLADLAEAVGWAADLGAHVVGLLPLHALANELPYGVSPYYPSSRLFLNPIYVAVDRVPEAAQPEVRALVDAPAFRERLERLRDAGLVDYPGVWAAKREALERCWDAFRRLHLEPPAGPTGRGAAFDGWCREQGRALEDFAAWSALRDHFTPPGGSAPPWQQWPEALRDPRGAGVREFRAEHGWQTGLHAYVQWLAHEQLEAAADLARTRGMAVGLYLDLALGVDPCGADAWMYQDVLALGASAGCPPDPFSLLGQRWGLPPAIPERHRETGYDFFLDTLERAADLTGALRIDHVLALWRLFWVPGDRPPSEGCYVAENPKELLALLRTVSSLRECLIVGEDLGTIPPEVRTGLAESGFYSYRVLIFEKGDDGRFRRPSDYPRQALVSVATHDLPTLDGFWVARDQEVKRALGRYPDGPAAEHDAEARRWDRLRLTEALAGEGLLPEGLRPDHDVPEERLDDLAVAVHAYLARTPAALLLANLDDLLGEREMQNLPGTLDEHPNWRRKVSLSLEDWPRLDRARRIAEAIGREGRARP